MHGSQAGIERRLTKRSSRPRCSRCRVLPRAHALKNSRVAAAEREEQRNEKELTKMKLQRRFIAIPAVFFLGTALVGVARGHASQSTESRPQQDKQSPPAQQKAGPGSQASPSLGMFVGAWNVMKTSASGGGISFDTYSKKVAIVQPRRGLVSFSFSDTETVQEEVAPAIPGVRDSITMPKSVPSRYSFSLKHDPASGKYLLTVNITVRGRPALSISNLPLTYTEDEGFTGEGTMLAGKQEGQAKASIKMYKDGGHSWTIASRDAFTLLFSRGKKSK